MRLLTFNANGVRSALRKGWRRWLEQQQPIDLVCLQEVRARREQVPLGDLWPAGDHVFWNASRRRQGYAGVAVLSRSAPDRVETELGWSPFDEEGRWLRLDFDALTLINVYLPSGSSSEERHAFKIACAHRLLDEMKRLRAAGRELIVCGDFNICHRPIDLENWRSNQKTSGFRPEDRAWMDAVVEAGFHDVFRRLYPEQRIYTWWSNRGRAYEKDVGWRLDYALTTAGPAAALRSAQVDRPARLSDHAPLFFDFTL